MQEYSLVKKHFHRLCDECFVAEKSATDKASAALASVPASVRAQNKLAHLKKKMGHMSNVRTQSKGLALLAEANALLADVTESSPTKRVRKLWKSMKLKPV